MEPTEPTSSLRLTVNGIAVDVAGHPNRRLLDVLRDELDITGPKPGCGEGVCGACTVLVDKRAVRACQTQLSDVAGADVLTVEGLAPQGQLHPVQRAFLEEGAYQCGFCTPGMILSSVAMLEAGPAPDEAAIRAGLADHICRCGTYPRILAAVRRAGAHEAGDRGGPDQSVEAAIDPVRRPGAPWDLTPTAERDWFDVLPDGLVVVTEPDWSGGWSTTSGAWLHVGADGVVTAFTGKVEAGQDTRTGLSIIVAEGVGVALGDVRLVMGDTDVCPHDQGTFGSRSTPDAGRELRALGEATRRILDDLAGAQSSRRPPLGELVRGLRRVEVARRRRTRRSGSREAGLGAELPTTPPGARRSSGRSIVTGEHRYPSDIARPGMLHGRVLHPPAAGAVLRSMQLDAMAGDGLTIVRDGPFVGVVAVRADLAASAIERAGPTWDLPDGPAEADLESHLRAHPVEDESWAGGFHRESGIVERALDDSFVRVEATYRTAFIAHVPMETRAAVAEWSGDGRLTIWTGTQVPFGVREEVATALAIPESSVRVIVPDFGGGFGGKHDGEVAIEAARLARAADAPVKVRWTREDEFRQGYLRPAAVIDVRAGADRDGRLAAWRMTNLNAGSFGLEGPYDVPNQALDYQPADAPLPQGSYRGLAATANHFARESAMDEIAVALEIDPVELRLHHLGDERLAAALRAAAERIEWTREREPGAGLGIAAGIEKEARVATAVELHVGADRRPRLTRIVTAFDCGRIVNPDALTNQVQGAISMGLGGALFEAIHFEAGGFVTNASLTDYRVPRITDVPEVEVILLDQPDVDSAGAGETPIVALAPAIGNAIFDAAGVRLRELPLVPDGRIPSIPA